MKRPVFWSREALADLKDASRFIAKDSPQVARRVAAAIRLAGHKLGQRSTGRKGRVSGTFEKSLPGLRYIIAYALHSLPDGVEAIVILHVIHAARDWPPAQWPKA